MDPARCATAAMGDRSGTGREHHRVSFGLDIPQSLVSDDSRVKPAEWFSSVEQSTIESLWTLDQLAGRMPSAEPVALLTFAAAFTSRLRLGVAVYVAAARNPVLAAKSIATLDRLSGGGRLVLGVGTGGPAHYSSYGHAGRAEGPGRILDEFLAVVGRLWREDSVTHAGPVWPMHEVTVEPKPVVPPPIWVGGSGPAAFRRTLTAASGWIGAGRHDHAEFASAVRELRSRLSAAGRPATDLTISKRVYLLVEPDHGLAERTIHRWFDLFYRRPDLGPRVTVAGDVDECAASLSELVAAGADELVLHPLVETTDQYSVILDELIPRVLAIGATPN